jgi:two-component system nitrogen regulation response regulator GlnG
MTERDAKKLPTLLVIDDEPSILLAFQRAYRNAGIEIVAAETAADGLRQARRQPPDVAVLDVQLPDASGLDLYRSLRQIDARCPVIFITGKSTTDTAIEAMKLGAYEYLLKPLELAQLRQVIDRAFSISRLMHVPAIVDEGDSIDAQSDAIIGRCPAMQEVYKGIGRVAPQEVTVLITGESGTGKELIARAIYQHSRRAEKPFRVINCAAIPETLLESELFGHEKGAFTGADRRRIGKFEQCAGGTLFLDEVADLSTAAQSKVLRLVQEKNLERLGGNEVIETDVRLLAATNQDLAGLVSAGRFREDLYYRLSAFTIFLPPLRTRGSDIDLLVHHYVRHFAAEFDRALPAVPEPTLARLRAYPWPGNIRELQNVLKQSLLAAAGNVLALEFLPPHIGPPGTERPAEAVAASTPLQSFVEERIHAGSTNLYGEALRRMERILLTRVLQHTAGNQVQAARILGITRGSLRTKIRDLGIVIKQTVAGDADTAD